MGFLVDWLFGIFVFVFDMISCLFVLHLFVLFFLVRFACLFCLAVLCCVG